MIELLPRLRRFARALARDPTDADDLVQLSLERALRRADQYRPELRLDSWMFGIMRHAWIDEVRAAQRRAKHMDEESLAAELSAPHPEPAETLALLNALHALPEDQKVAIALVLVEGLSYREAAEVAGVPEGTLTSRVARGRAALLAQLEGDI